MLRWKVGEKTLWSREKQRQVKRNFWTVLTASQSGNACKFLFGFTSVISRIDQRLRNKTSKPEFSMAKYLSVVMEITGFNNLLRFLSSTKLNKTETRREFSWIQSMKNYHIQQWSAIAASSKRSRQDYSSNRKSLLSTADFWPAQSLLRLLLC